MKRRIFLTSLMASAGTMLGPPELIKLDLSGGIETVKVKAGDIVLAKSGTCLRLPSQPKNGDSVHIIIDSTALEHPCSVVSLKEKVAGDREPLILDSLANIKLIYRKETKNWVLA